MIKKRLASFLIAGAAGLLVTIAWVTGTLDEWNDKCLDIQFNLRGQISVAPSIVIVSFDENSIQHLGRWPWPRATHGKMIDILRRAGARAIVFDTLFVEPDRTDPLSDAAFAAAAQRAGNVVIGSFIDENDALRMPIENFAACRIGLVNHQISSDGISRNAPLMAEQNGSLYPALPLSALSVFEGREPGDIIKQLPVQLHHNGRFFEIMVNYAGPYRTFPYYSFYDVLSGSVPATAFKDKLVLLGGTAAALFDQKNTPFTPGFPGVEIHANVLSNLLMSNSLRPFPVLLTPVLILAGALLAGFLLTLLSPFWSGAAVAGVFSGVLYGAFLLFARANIAVELIPVALGLLLGYASVLFYRFIKEEKEKRHIKKTFGHYLSPRVMERVLSDPSYLRLGGQRQNLTVLFSDIRNFTTMSEAMKPEDIVPFLNEYLSKMVEVVFRHDGTLDKFIGDAVMAVWGAPVPQNDHPRRAVCCAIEMMEELARLKEKWKTEGKPLIDIGIGINSGDMVVGNMGSREKMEYTVIGDNVNLASRLEGLNKTYGTNIIISDATYQAVKNEVDVKLLGSVTVKGKTRPVEVYSVTVRKEFAS